VSGQMADRLGGLTCADATDLAGLYVLHALEPAEHERVAAHLAECPEAHAEFASTGGVTPALASLAEPINAPPALKTRVLADYRAANGTRPAAAPMIEPHRYRPQWLTWAAAAAAVLVIAVAAGWGFVEQSRADAEAHRAQVLAQAIDVMSAPDSSVAVLRGTASAAGASGFATFSASGAGYIVVVDLPQAPAGQTYQAWYIAGDRPASAGLLSVDRDGVALLALPGQPGTNVIALTIEPAGGSAQPTSNPIVSGELVTHA